MGEWESKEAIDHHVLFPVVRSRTLLVQQTNSSQSPESPALEKPYGLSRSPSHSLIHLAIKDKYILAQSQALCSIYASKCRATLGSILQRIKKTVKPGAAVVGIWGFCKHTLDLFSLFYLSRIRECFRIFHEC